MKILASDLDGTLLFKDSKEKIKKTDLIKIKKFQEQGNLFGLCTGRAKHGVIYALEETDLKLDFMILNSGSTIIINEDNFIKNETMPRELITTIDQITSKYNCSKMFVTKDGQFFINRKFEANSVNKTIYSSNEIEAESFLMFAMNFPDLKELNEVKTMLKKQFGDQIEVHQNVDNLDIAPKNCSKGNAIKELQTYLKVNSQNIFVIGDSYNDISMFEVVQNSFTFNNSPKEVKEKAKYHVNSVSECINLILNK